MHLLCKWKNTGFAGGGYDVDELRRNHLEDAKVFTFGGKSRILK
jgi:hypothetical protein